MQVRFNLFFFTLLLSTVSAIGASGKQPSTCGPQVRAAFDVGSGSTKMKVAKVDTCTQTLIATILEDQVKVDYRDQLEKSQDGEFPEPTLQAGREAFKNLLAKAKKSGATHFAGVATAAFRSAKNGAVFLTEIKSNLKINIRIISQEEEAHLGFRAVSQTQKLPMARILVWDIGGGSQQMMTLNEKSQAVIYDGKLASVSFKNKVIAQVQNKNINEVNSPNPLSAPQIVAAKKLAQSEARNEVPEPIKTKILNMPDLTVVGIGGVLSRSIVDNTPGDKTEIKLEDLEKGLKTKTDKTDAEIGGEYAATEVTNMVLVSAYMQALKIKSYRPLRLSLIDGLWFDADLWE